MADYFWICSDCLQAFREPPPGGCACRPNERSAPCIPVVPRSRLQAVEAAAQQLLDSFQVQPGNTAHQQAAIRGEAIQRLSAALADPNQKEEGDRG
jgi:hypothetical protein